MSKPRVDPPDVPTILGGLKDFQRKTVAHVHNRFFIDDDSTQRFLVADEVGLGKTLVAKGVTALALDHLWEKTKRIDVIYICSNAEIARQNINRLKVVDGVKYAKPTRLTLLPLAIHDMRKQKLNLISLTPGTSFDPKSSMGTARERALLYLMLRDEWDLGNRKPPLSIFCANMVRRNFEGRVRWIDREERIDRRLWDRFLKDLRAEERRLRKANEPTLKMRFEELASGQFRKKQRSHVDDDAKRIQRFLIRDLRSLLAHSCIDSLEPDLVILDEFQRFKSLLDPENEAGELATQLFDYLDEETKESTRTLLLSATPYKAYATASDVEGTDHYSDFVATVRFLLNDSEQADRLGEDFEQMRTAVLSWGSDGEERASRTRGAIEKSLRRVVARTERLASSADRNGMLRQVEGSTSTLTSDDLANYLGLQAIARALKQHDTLEYWKSSPYLVNLMDDYKLKRELTSAIEERRFGGIAGAMAADGAGLLNWDEIQEYGAIDPGNARMRELMEQTIEAETWRLLWLAPSLPYYGLSGPYASVAAQNFTKRLAFSSWNVVPKAISLLLSYEAERKMSLEANPDVKNDETRSDRAGRLQISMSGGRLTGMPVLALMYPSFALAELVDPKDAAAAIGQQTSRAQVLQHAKDRIREELSTFRGAARRGGRVDERWYWAAPLLLDQQRDAGRTGGWLRSPALAKLGTREDVRGQESRWQDHLDQATDMLDASDLGRPPKDLLTFLAELSIAGPGVTALRALTRGSSQESLRDPSVRLAAMKVAWGFRSLFNLPEVHDLVSAQGKEAPYWRQTLNYCVDGCLQSTLDEYAHVLIEHTGHVGGEVTAEVADDVAQEMSDAVGIRTTRGTVDFYESNRGRIKHHSERMRARYALRFGDQTGEDDKVLARADQVRTAFNSPFWPFVLASTSVGQEGLDFHVYCHAIVHWNLPSNPVDLEQREGRIHRFKGHAIRRNLARDHGASVLKSGSADPWNDLFAAGEAVRPADESELWPFWVYTSDGTNGSSAPIAMIERHVPALPLSRDMQRLDRLAKSLALYRSVLGQPRQDDLIRILTEQVPPEDWERCADLLKIDLSPPSRPALVTESSRRNGTTDSKSRGVKDDSIAGLDWLEEYYPGSAEMPLRNVRDAYETGSELMRGLLDELSGHPDEPRSYAEVERRLGWDRGKIAQVFGGYSNKSKARYKSKRPFRFGLGTDEEWWIWMDARRAQVIRKVQR